MGTVDGSYQNQPENDNSVLALWRIYLFRTIPATVWGAYDGDGGATTCVHPFMMYPPMMIRFHHYRWYVHDVLNCANPVTTYGRFGFQ